jgi:heptosyltransferase-2/heptosyltransferase-3
MTAALSARARNLLIPIAGRTVRRPVGERENVVLVLQPDHLGDILLSQPAVAALRARYRTERLVAVVGEWSREMARVAWPVDEVDTLPFAGFARGTQPSSLEPYQQLRDAARQLARFRASAAVVLRPDAWWAAWLAALSAPRVIGSSDPRVAAFATDVATVSDDAHAVVRAWTIAAAAGGDFGDVPDWSVVPLSLPLDGAAARSADELLRARGIESPCVVVHPGAGAAVKEWPVHRWRVVVARLAGAGLAVVVSGGAGERELCAGIAAGMPNTVSVAGTTPLPLLIELLRRARLVVGSDCGPLHLAVAAGTPTLHLFGPSDPKRYGPWGDPSRHVVLRSGWSCPRCGDLSSDRPAGCGCMLAIETRQVVDSALRLLDSHVAG